MWSERLRQPTRRTALAAMLSFAPRGHALEVVEPLRLQIGGGRIEVRFSTGAFDVGREGIEKWISDAAHAVTAYFGRFPVMEEVVEVQAVADKAGIFGGVTYNSKPARTEIEVGERTSRAMMQDDWTMTHELTHLGFPNVARKHHWIEEGIATYVEPIARAQAGTMRVEKVWADMFHDMAKGEPDLHSGGLDQDHSWASTYWGGALFCLVADVQFRERTGNRYGLQDALRGVLAAGGNIQADWPIERALQTGDKAAGANVLEDLYSRAKDQPLSTDLARLWRRLGVAAAGSAVSFDPGAELAPIRLAITARRS